MTTTNQKTIPDINDASKWWLGGSFALEAFDAKKVK